MWAGCVEGSVACVGRVAVLGVGLRGPGPTTPTCVGVLYWVGSILPLCKQTGWVWMSNSLACPHYPGVLRDVGLIPLYHAKASSPSLGGLDTRGPQGVGLGIDWVAVLRC